MKRRTILTYLGLVLSVALMVFSLFQGDTTLKLVCATLILKDINLIIADSKVRQQV